MGESVLQGSRSAAWGPAGPKAQAYGQSRADLAAIIGPTGGGKTTESARRVLRVAQWQDVSPRDGLRKARIGVICTTYRRLWDQVTNSYFKEINREWGVEGPNGKSGFTGAKGDPWDHKFLMSCPDGTTAYVEVMGRAVGDADLEDFFRGLEVTAFWVPELDTHESGDILTGCQNRVGRYPEPDDRPEPVPGKPATYAGVWADMNAPVIGSWAHGRFYIKPHKGDEVFIQPSGFSPQAENLRNLNKINPNYYKDLAARMKEPWAIKRFIENQPGYTRHGEPVHQHFDAERMVVKSTIPPDPYFELLIAADCGNTLNPAAVFFQRVGMQMRALAEIVPPPGGMDLVEFAARIKTIRETIFVDIKEARLVIDPSASSRSVLNRQLSLGQILSHYTGLDVVMAPTNAPGPRRTALDQVLKRPGMPGEPGFLVGNNCPALIAALAGGYRFKRHGDKISEVPEKNHPHSDIADAAQYGALAMEGLGLGGGFIHDPREGPQAQDPRPILQD